MLLVTEIVLKLKCYAVKLNGIPIAIHVKSCMYFNNLISIHMFPLKYYSLILKNALIEESKFSCITFNICVFTCGYFWNQLQPVLKMKISPHINELQSKSKK